MERWIKRESISKLLAVPRRSVYCTINRYKELGTFCYRPKCGRPGSVDTPPSMNKIRNRIRINPQHSLKKLAKDLKISTWFDRNIIKCKQHLHSYKLSKAHFLLSLTYK